jgi:hypothetical protein
MNYGQQLWRVEIVGLIALTIVSVLVGISLYIDVIDISDEIGGIDAFFLGFQMTLLIGFLAVTVYGAPLYVLYLRHKAFPKWALFVASTIPGLLIYVSEVLDEWGAAYGVASGLLIALIGDFFAGKWPNLTTHDSD